MDVILGYIMNGLNILNSASKNEESEKWNLLIFSQLAAEIIL